MSQYVDPIHLRQVLTEHYNLGELRTLCFELGIDFEEFGGGGKTEKVVELVAYAQRHNRLDDIAASVRRTHPTVPLKMTDTLPELPPAGIGSGVSIFPLHNLPHPNPNFTGRQALLDAIHAAFRNPQSAIAITQAIAGLGGVGKTQLALAYAHAHRDDYDLVWLLHADDAAGLDGDLRQLGMVLRLPLPTDAPTARQMVLSWLNGTDKRWLLLYDNADQLEARDLRPYLPGGGGHVLITSRRRTWRDAQTLRLDVFTAAEAADFWRKRLELELEKEGTLAALAEELGYLPLALEQAAAYMGQRQKTPAQYLALYRERRRELWDREKRPDDYHATILTTWEMAFDHARQTPGAAALLNLCCFLAPEAIPLEVIVAHAEALPEELAAVLGDEMALDDALDALQAYSLLARTDGALSIHRLVQAVAREQMGEERAKIWAEAAINLLNDAWPFDSGDMNTWIQSSQLLPQLLNVADIAAQQEIITTQAASLNGKADFYLDFFGNKQQALPYSKRALAIREKALGPDHPDTATSLNNLGVLLRAMGNLAEARPYYERALAINEKALGPDHPDTATSLNNLGYLLQAMGNLAEARPYFERALAINEKALGPHHPDTATSLNNLGYLLQAMGNLAEARPYFERALAINEKALGPDHPDTATSLNNLGYLLQAMGNLAEARPYYERALAIREKALGPDHPTTATSLNNLGGLLDSMGNLAEARPYYERALAIDEKALGPDHPTTKTIRNNLMMLNLQAGTGSQSVDDLLAMLKQMLSNSGE